MEGKTPSLKRSSPLPPVDASRPRVTSNQTLRWASALFCGGLLAAATLQAQETGSSLTTTAPNNSPAATSGSPSTPPLPTTIIEPPLPVFAPGEPAGSSPSAPASSGASALVPPTTDAAAVGSSPPAAGPSLPASVPAETGSTRRFRYAFRLAISAAYDDNLQLAAGHSGGGFYFTLEPGITLGIGDAITKEGNYLRLDYAPSVFIYAEDSDFNSLQHLVRLEGGYRWTRLSLTASQDVQILDGADLNVTSNTGTVVNRVNLDVSARTRLNIYVSRANFGYFLTEKTALNLALQYSRNDYRSLLSSQITSGDLSVSYTYSPKLTAGLGVTVGYLVPERPSVDQDFEQVNVRLNYQLFGKVSANGSFGLEVREFGGSDGGTKVTPVLELGVLYQPFDSTTLSLSATRRVLSSATLAQQDFTTTNVTVSGRQRFLQKIFFTLTFGYENADYFSTNRAVSASRRDNYFYVQASAEYAVTKFWNLGGFYTHRQNDSTGAGTSFTDNQVGLRTSFSF